MSYNKNRFRHDSIQNRKSVHQILDAITEGIANGRLVFSDEDDKIEMTPEDLLELKVTASQEDDRERVNIRISWHTQTNKKSRKKRLSISS